MTLHVLLTADTSSGARALVVGTARASAASSCIQLIYKPVWERAVEGCVCAYPTELTEF